MKNNYKFNSVETSKKKIENLLGISYDDFMQLDDDEKELLIECKSGRKMKYDIRVRLDCVPVADIRINDFISRPKTMVKMFTNRFRKR